MSIYLPFVRLTIFNHLIVRKNLYQANNEVKTYETVDKVMDTSLDCKHLAHKLINKNKKQNY